MQSPVLAGQCTMSYLMGLFHQLSRVQTLIDKGLVDGVNVDFLIIFQGQLVSLMQIQLVQRRLRWGRIGIFNFTILPPYLLKG